MSKQQGLTTTDVEHLLVRLGPVCDDLVLVGGQAVFVCGTSFEGHPAMGAIGSPTSMDVDFQATPAAVRRAAKALGGQAQMATMDDVTPHVGVVTFVDASGAQRVIDFLEAPFGLDARDVKRTSIVLDFEAKPGSPGLTLRVMHPVVMLESRVHNTASLPGYGDAHALAQLQVAFRSTKAFLLLLLDRAERKAVLRLAERLFRFAHNDADALEVYKRHGVDPFDAVPAEDERLPAAFRDRRVPQIREWLRVRRSPAARSR